MRIGPRNPALTGGFVGIHTSAMLLALERLEVGTILAALRTRTQTPLGAAEVNGLSLLSDVTEARARIDAVSEARALLDRGDPAPVWGAQDVATALGQGEKGIMLEGPALRAIADTMLAGSRLHRHVLEHEEFAPLLFALAASIADLSRTAGEVQRCFDRDGQLADDASEHLGPLRRKVRALRERISERITELLHSSGMRDHLQEDYYTIRGDRYVLPIKAAFKNEVQGIVHDASGSGQTVFIEPQVIVDLGNRLKIAQSEQVEEEHRILGRLTRLVVRNADAIRAMMGVIGRVDLYFGMARLAQDLRCVAVKPETDPGFHLVGAKHPLLLLQTLSPPSAEREEASSTVRVDAVVGNDFGLGEAQNILVITGPNTGGKTVAMKTIGLCAALVRMGFHLPCREGSRIGWYERIEVAIGDQQSIASNLSTFAAHIKALVAVLGRADARTLVLVDEIASDTDPNQGQALGQAILERFADRGAHAVVTTHFERLKALPFVDPRFRNAGVGFDETRLAPTYKVTLDVPQGSSALDIAHRLGLADALVDRARSLLGEGSGALDTLLAAVDKRGHALRLAVEDAQARQREADEARRRMEAETERLEAARRRLVAEARAELLEDIAASREEVRQLVARLQKAAKGGDPRAGMRTANQVADRLAKLEKREAGKVEPPSDRKAKAPVLEHVEVGSWVHVSTIGRDGEVLAVDGKEATVVVGNLRSRLPLSTLLKPHKPRPKAAKVSRPPPARQRASASRIAEAEKVLFEEIDLRGSTVDECIDRLEAFLDHHYGMPTTHVRVVHGHGTGALREAVREHLARSGYVRGVRPGEPKEGGDGVTVVALS